MFFLRNHNESLSKDFTVTFDLMHPCWRKIIIFFQKKNTNPEGWVVCVCVVYFSNKIKLHRSTHQNKQTKKQQLTYHSPFTFLNLLFKKVSNWQAINCAVVNHRAYCFLPAVHEKMKMDLLQAPNCVSWLCFLILSVFYSLLKASCTGTDSGYTWINANYQKHWGRSLNNLLRH